jgi:glycosyltransferase involved in cell wall biosynthesis
MDTTIDVILPALDEVEAIPSVLGSLPSGFRPIVVDNGSTDGSGALAASLGALVVHEPRRGFGAACLAGLLAADADVVAFMDCDGSFRGSDLARVAAPVLAGRADLVLGARNAARGAWPLHARLGNRWLGRSIRRRTGVRLRDLGPMRAARRVDLLGLGITDLRSGWPLEMVLRAGRADWRIEEIEVGYEPRLGRSKVTGTVRGTVEAVRDMRRVLA